MIFPTLEDHAKDILACKEYLEKKQPATRIRKSTKENGGALPLSAYHCRLSKNALTSSSIFSETPSSNTTLLSGRFLLGSPNGLHSIPQAVITTSFPSCPFIASSLASLKSCGNKNRSLESVVRVTVSQGCPDIICIDRVSRSRLTCIHAPRYLNQCVPGPATRLNLTDELPFFRCSKAVSTLNWWLLIQGTERERMDREEEGAVWDWSFWVW